MKIKQISNDIDIKKYLKNLDVEGGGRSIMAAKHEHYLIEVQDLHVGAANILKQDALSVGADFAVPKGTVVAKTPRVDGLLIATKRHLEVLAQKEKLQPFGLKEVGAFLERIVKTASPKKVQLMGVLNANDDSFYASSRFRAVEATKKIEEMIAQGADIVDIGAVSSRPGAKEVSAQEEMDRLRDIVTTVARERFYERVRFSIDSYTPEAVAYALDNGFSIINDITGFENDELCRLAAKYNAQAVVMHMQGTPQTMQQNPTYEDVVEEVYGYLRRQTEKLASYGVDDVVLDVGIGFGKTLQHNIDLLRHLKHFRTLGKKLLIGASRKSMIDKISPSPTEERLAGTLALHLRAVEEGADILRVHDVYEHAQAFRVWERLKTI